jgi:beta-lactamase class A
VSLPYRSSGCTILAWAIAAAGQHFQDRDYPIVQHKIAQISSQAGTKTAAVAFHDYETESAFSLHGSRWFHAASTIKIAVLAATFLAIEDERFTLESRVHVRNRFVSVVDGEPYRIPAARDANSKVHAAIGKTMRVDELAFHMIVTSSNLATNLLLDLIGLERAGQLLAKLNVEGIDLRRGVEDDKAFEAQINNRVTADGLVRLLRMIQEERGFSPGSSQKMLSILNQQEFNSGIPAGLPQTARDAARIAHKTGEISTAAHDAGIIYLPKRKPYVLAILTEWSENNSSSRMETVAKISEVVYGSLVEEGASKGGASE